ncbi:hypothetical protein MLD38_026634 [Melastoma candidum]|uniref:Uncharacterized protein n=1 Tax=Melastoma candidum TaxID=119954 RepID=A0ACB9NZ77_9MYRT|nr:hypothetical protein MLD38_026634 [Melastoma candidum]
MKIIDRLKESLNPLVEKSGTAPPGTSSFSPAFDQKEPAAEQEDADLLRWRTLQLFSHQTTAKERGRKICRALIRRWNGRITLSEDSRSLGDDHVICVIEDVASRKIVATGSIFVERKFIRGCGKVGHIEDVVVDGSTRGLSLGKRVVSFLADHARSVGCYKVILDCSMDNRAFYEKCGFKQKEVQMVRYFT